jgi:hypothetical protein
MDLKSSTYVSFFAGTARSDWLDGLALRAAGQCAERGGTGPVQPAASAVGLDRPFTRRTAFKTVGFLALSASSLSVLSNVGEARAADYCSAACTKHAQDLYIVQLKEVCKPPLAEEEHGEALFGLSCAFEAWLERRSDLKDCAKPNCGNAKRYPKPPPTPPPTPPPDGTPYDYCALCQKAGGICCGQTPNPDGSVTFKCNDPGHGC